MKVRLEVILKCNLGSVQSPVNEEMSVKRPTMSADSERTSAHGEMCVLPDSSMNKRPSNYTHDSNIKRQKLEGKEEEGPLLNPGRNQQIESTDVKNQEVEYYGLINQGATCYLNCILQVLFMTPGIQNRLNKEKDTDLELQHLFDQLKYRACQTRSITQRFGIKDVSQQKDAAECLGLLLPQLSPEVSKLFQVELRHSTKCDEEIITHWTLPLSLSDSDHLYIVEKGFESIFGSTSFHGDNKVYCQTCHKNKDASSECDVENEYPLILTLLLKRFDLDIYGRCIKTHRLVAIPATLERETAKYELYGIVRHMGGQGGGHYTATIQASNNTWYDFDDARVQKAADPFPKGGVYRSSTAYLLMYKKTEIPDETNSGRQTGETEERSDEHCAGGELHVPPDSSMNKRPSNYTHGSNIKGEKLEGKEEEGPLLNPGRNQQIESTDVKNQEVEYYGLINQGATCYLNCILQVLFMTPGIQNRLNKEKDTDLELQHLFDQLKYRACQTRSITQRFGIKDVFQQKDAAECLGLLLPQLSPEVSKLFQVELRHSTNCDEGHTVNEETITHWTLPLSLSDSDHLYIVEKGFESIFGSTSFHGDNKVYCQTCRKNKDASSECDVENEYPLILTLLLKRFDLDIYGRCIKTHRLVAIPATLERATAKYELYGIVHHMGGQGGGHYTATIQASNNTWYDFDDAHVQKAADPFPKGGVYRSKTAYLLMYKKTEIPDETNSGRQTGEIEERSEEHCAGGELCVPPDPSMNKRPSNYTHESNIKGQKLEGKEEEGPPLNPGRNQQIESTDVKNQETEIPDETNSGRQTGEIEERSEEHCAGGELCVPPDPSMNKRPSNYTHESNIKGQKLEGKEEEGPPLNPGRNQQIESTDVKNQETEIPDETNSGRQTGEIEEWSEEHCAGVFCSCTWLVGLLRRGVFKCFT
ncbi:uncharacterized protein LOC143009180 isoform X2 [Genypterus blacodes]|uniref:uncharacterized protein LOC143009180 isoform X2 n=1 Tax=Genypterus blacodes TaxID=154954 RepID=UPI003F76E432